MKKIITVFLLTLSLAFLCVAQDDTVPANMPEYDWNSAGRIIIQDGGRIKPLDTFARELVAKVHGKDDYEGQHPVESYFRWMADGEKWSKAPLIYLPKGQLRTELGFADHDGHYFSIVELQETRKLMEIVMEAQTAQNAGEKLTFMQSSAGELLGKLSELSDIFAHEAPLIVPTPDGDPMKQWSSMPTAMEKYDDLSDAAQNSSDTTAALGLAFSGLYHSIRDNRPDIFNTSASVFVTTQHEMMAGYPDALSKIETELLYNRLRPFLWARVLLFAGFFLFLFSLKEKWRRYATPAMFAFIGGLLFFTLGMAMRAYIGGRAPWSNMFESLLAIGWTVTVVSLIFEIIRRDRIFGLSGSLMGGIILALAHFASLDRGINPLVPALQSYWLNYHTLCVLMSYACFALAMVIGHVVLISAVRNKGQKNPSIDRMMWANLKIVQLGSVLLIFGILLGAVWANVSWGRFWGWDPKETWALISWFVYIIMLHGRSAGWLSWRGFAASTVGVFPVIVMTYYGVNFFLSGLHSYGAGSTPGIPWEVFVYLGLETAFLIWVMNKLRGTLPDEPQKPTASKISPAPTAAKA